MTVETAELIARGDKAALRVRLLGPLALCRGGVQNAGGGQAVELPASRKVRALFAYLAMAPEPITRQRLCDLLWDGPNDPRGELRWCLSKLRGVLDEPDRARVVTAGETVALDLADSLVDVREITGAVEAGLDTLEPPRLQMLAGLFAGDFLEGLEIDRSPHFSSWLAAHRRRLHDNHVAILQQLVGRLPAASEVVLPILEKWVELAPFDGQAHLSLLDALIRRGQIAAGEAHLDVAAGLFQSEGLDVRPLRAAWRELRDRSGPAMRATVTAAVRPVVAGPVVVGPRGGSVIIPAASITATPNTAVRATDFTEIYPVTIDQNNIAASAIGPVTDPAPARRASLAVMPFKTSSEAVDGLRGGLADGLTHDIITRLAKLRDIFVIARGSVFALAEEGVSSEVAGRRLNVDYVASGTVHQQAGRIGVTVELVEVSTARIVWAEVFDRKLDGAFTVLDDIGNRIVSSIAAEIEMVERNRAILLPPNSLDAWQAYHRGLWHMYRFTRAENETAQHFFQTAVRLDPTFARAYAGLSFTHWQSAFQNWADRSQDTERAYAAASQSLMADEHNPASHWAMGRALWLRGNHDQSLAELERSVDLSPNFALGHYALSFVQSQSGDPQAAIRSSDHSRDLSPFDPLLFGMLGARAMAHVRLGQFAEAADWALKAAARPNAHATILAIAAHCLGLAGRLEEGRAFAAAVHKSLPQYRVEDFLATFQFTPEAVALFRQGGKLVGLG